MVGILAGCLWDDGSESPTPTPSPTPEPVRLTSGSATLYDGLLYESWSVELNLPDGGIVIFRTGQIELFGGNPMYLANDQIEGTFAPYQREYLELEPGSHQVRIDLPQGTVPEVTIELHHPDAIHPDEYRYPINSEIFEVSEVPSTIIETETVGQIRNKTDWFKGVIRTDTPVTLVLEVHEIEGDSGLNFTSTLNDDQETVISQPITPGPFFHEFTAAGEIFFRLSGMEPDSIESYTVSVHLVETETHRSNAPFELVDLTAPDAVLPHVEEGGEEWQWSFTVQNTTQFPALFSSTIQRFDDSSEWRDWREVDLKVVPGGLATYESTQHVTWKATTHRYRIEGFEDEVIIEPDVTVLAPGMPVQADGFDVAIGPFESVTDSIGTITVPENIQYVLTWVSITNTGDEPLPASLPEEFSLVGATYSLLHQFDEDDAVEDAYPTESALSPGESYEGWVFNTLDRDLPLEDVGVQIGEKFTPGESYIWTVADEFGPFYERPIIELDSHPDV